MAPKKKVVGLIKLQIQAGAANPAPPVGPALGQHGVNIMGVLQGLQRGYRISARKHCSRRDHRVRGPLLHLHH